MTMLMIMMMDMAGWSRVLFPLLAVPIVVWLVWSDPLDKHRR